MEGQSRTSISMLPRIDPTNLFPTNNYKLDVPEKTQSSRKNVGRKGAGRSLTIPTLTLPKGKWIGMDMDRKIQESQENGGMKSAGRSLGSLGWIKVKNALGNGLLKFQAKPSVKGPEWDPKVRPLDANGRPIHYHQDDILHSLMYPNGRPQIPQIPVKYQIRPIPQQPPSPQNIRPPALVPSLLSKSTFHEPYPKNPQYLQDAFRRNEAKNNQQMLKNRLSMNGRMQPVLPSYPKVGPNGENLNFGKIYSPQQMVSFP